MTLTRRTDERTNLLGQSIVNPGVETSEPVSLTERTPDELEPINITDDEDVVVSVVVTFLYANSPLPSRRCFIGQQLDSMLCPWTRCNW